MSKFLRMLAWASVIVALTIALLRGTAIRWWQIPLSDPYLAASIAPSLRAGDWVLLWRATAPLYGDLVLCPEPKASGRVVVGRIVAEQGDHLKIQGDQLIVNQHPVLTETSCDKFRTLDPSTHAEVQQYCDMEVVASHAHPRGGVPQDVLKPLDVEVDVPQGQVFLVSDNRLFPWDSREFGPVDRATCTESVVFRLVSKDGFFDVPNRLMLIH